MKLAIVPAPRVEPPPMYAIWMRAISTSLDQRRAPGAGRGRGVGRWGAQARSRLDASTALESGPLAPGASNRRRPLARPNRRRAGQPARSAYTRRLSLWPRTSREQHGEPWKRTPARRRRPRGARGSRRDRSGLDGQLGGQLRRQAADTTRSRTTATSRSTCWSADNQDPGPSRSSRRWPRQFEKKYPNVKINLKFKGFTTTSRSSSSRSTAATRRTSPRATRATRPTPLLVKAKLIMPLDKLRQEVRLEQVVLARRRRSSSAGRPTARRSARATSGASRSSGSRPASSTTRRCSRSTAAIPNNMPTTFADFDKLLATLRAKAPDERCRSSRSATRTATSRCTPSAWCRARTSPAPVHAQLDLPRAGQRPTTTPANIKALTTFQQWVKDGYFGSDYNARRRERRRGRVRQGQGRLLPRRQLAGRRSSRAGLKANAGFMDMPPGPSGKYVAIGATSLPWHISAKTKYPGRRRGVHQLADRRARARRS